jgi:hypothetical protein
MVRTEHIHRGVSPDDIVRVLLQTEDPENFPKNVVNEYRAMLEKFITENWDLVWSQLTCNSCCEECSDAKPIDCVFQNRTNLPGFING